MSIEIKEIIKDFLTDAEPSIICIKGEWGVGKTYLWKEKSKTLIKKQNYSYVSLFGINSIDELKTSIYTNNSSLGVINKSSEIINKFGLSVLEKLTGINVNIDIKDIANWETEDYTICFDDIERRGENLKLKDILGLANDLKEIKNCRSVFLVNLKEEKEADSFMLYEEKVIDTSIALNPTLDECLKITKAKHDKLIALQDKYIASFKQACELCGTSNIRLIIKIGKSFDKFYKELELAKYDKDDKDEEITNSILHLFVLLSYCHYTGNDNSDNADENSVPNLDIIEEKFGPYFVGAYSRMLETYQNKTKEEKKEFDKYRHWMESLRNKKINTGEDFFPRPNYSAEIILIKYIIKFLKYGYSTNDDKKNLILFLDNFTENKESNILIDSIWEDSRNYKNNYDDVADKFCTAILETKNKHYEKCGSSLENIINFLYEYKDKKRYLKLINEFKNFIQENDDFKRMWYWHRLDIPEVEDILKKALDNKEVNKEITVYEFSDPSFTNNDINIERFRNCSYENLKILFEKNYEWLRNLARKSDVLDTNHTAYENLKKLLDDLEKDETITLKNLITHFKKDMNFPLLATTEPNKQIKHDVE